MNDLMHCIIMCGKCSLIAVDEIVDKPVAELNICHLCACGNKFGRIELDFPIYRAITIIINDYCCYYWYDFKSLS